MARAPGTKSDIMDNIMESMDNIMDSMEHPLGPNNDTVGWPSLRRGRCLTTCPFWARPTRGSTT